LADQLARVVAIKLHLQFVVAEKFIALVMSKLALVRGVIIKELTPVAMAVLM
jgi:hypothetical protein